MVDSVMICSTANEHAKQGHMPPFEHVSRCAVCLRRQRMVEAELLDAEPLSEVEAQDMLAIMAQQFAHRTPGKEPEEYLRFYATLAQNTELEEIFAIAVAMEIEPAQAPSPEFAQRIKNLGESRWNSKG